MGTPFNMKGSAFYGKGNQSPVSQIGGAAHTTTPPPGWRAERQAPAAPAAPSAASLDYVNPVEQRAPRTREPQLGSQDWANPVEGSSPASQVQAKQELGAAGNAAANKAEMYAKRAQGPIEQRVAKNNSQAATNKAEMQAVRTAQGGPVEGGPLEPTPYTPSNPGSTGTSSGGPGGGPGPMAQVAPKTKISDVDAMTKNKMEAYQAKAAQGGPIEQKKKKKKK